MAKHIATTKFIIIVLITIVLLVVGVIGSLLRPYYLKHQAITIIEDAGGWVETSNVGPKWLIDLQEKWMDEPYLVDVYYCIFYNKTSKEQGKYLSCFPNLVTLKISVTQAIDAELIHLKGMTKLGGLDLSNTQVTDAGLIHLKGLTNLGILRLSDTQVTDAGLIHLKGLTNLQYLFLSDTQVTDAGLAHLKELTKLEYLELSDTQVTDAGIESLQKALPKCEIYN